MTSTGDKLYGLVLCGGKSTRMGTDKGLIEYHDIPQREYVYRILEEVCDRVYLSIREGQAGSVDKVFEVVIDRDEFSGPFNGILSAHELDRSAAWLVLACDLPLMTPESVNRLVIRRNKSKLATAYASKESKLPEPLIAIWEPEALKKARQYLEKGPGTGPRKFLMQSDVELIHPEKESVLFNVNSREEFEKVVSRIGSRSS